MDFIIPKDQESRRALRGRFSCAGCDSSAGAPPRSGSISIAGTTTLPRSDEYDSAKCQIKLSLIARYSPTYFYLPAACWKIEI